MTTCCSRCFERWSDDHILGFDYDRLGSLMNLCTKRTSVTTSWTKLHIITSSRKSYMVSFRCGSCFILPRCWGETLSTRGELSAWNRRQSNSLSFAGGMLVELQLQRYRDTKRIANPMSEPEFVLISVTPECVRCIMLCRSQRQRISCD